MDKTDTLIWTPPSADIEKEKLWITKEIKHIGISKLQKLAKQAATSRANSYSPYSKYKVGVALLTSSGKISTGVNAEVASYSESDHAEESAITGAIIAGEIQKSGRKFIRALAVSHDSNSAPCGRCRQIIVEHCDNALIVVCDTKGAIRRITSVKVLLPYAFSPSDLGIR
jgi:cytidine deaminase